MTESTATAVLPEPEAAAPNLSKEEGDPQNALTRQFTDEEWKAVRELRGRLSAIFNEAYPARETAKAGPITLWGVKIDPENASDARVSVVLVKFLRARNLNVADAQKMLLDTLRWREEFKVEQACAEEFPDGIFGGLGRISGHDTHNRPVVYNLYGANKNLNAVFGDVERFLRWRVAFMEQCIELLDFETVDQMVQIHDYDGVSMMAGRDANQKAAASQASALFQNYYPEFLSSKFFVNVPGLMAWVFWLFKPFLSAKTLEKFSMVGSGPKTIGAALLPLIDATQLPKRYGGEADDLA